MLKTWIDDHMDRELEDLKGLLRIPSVSRGTPEPGMPLGREVNDAMEYTLALAKKLGFTETKNLDGYCATVEFGEGDEMLMIAAHLDVVPAGKGWNSDPFEPVIRNGRMICRGVLDDKGPAVSALYAMAAVKESGLKMKRRVRLFLGGDEEVGWQCIDRYKETEEMPTLGFTPDGGYPVVNSEMGILQAKYVLNTPAESVKIHCGTAANVVPGEAEAELAFEAVPCGVPEGYTAEFEGNTIRVKSFGGHAAMNDLAKNALHALLDILTQQPLSDADYAAASALHALFDYDCHGEGFGLDVKDESGYLTLSLDMMDWDENGLAITLDSRHPFSISEQEVYEKLDASLCVLGFERNPLKHQDGLFVPRDSELVSTLLDIYNTILNRHSEPLAIGGGTYSRAFPNMVAFGPEPEGDPGECHMPNESMGLADIRFNTLAMAEAIRRLAAE